MELSTWSDCITRGGKMVMRNTAVHPRKQKSLSKCAHLRPHHWQEGDTLPGSERTRGSSAMTTPVLVLNASYEPIRLIEYRRIPHQTRALSRKNILLRDRNSCQYCNVILTSSELTLDHVVPRSRGGLSTWENLVACCHSCNRRKGNQMLHELRDMKLIREPRPFTLHTSRHIMRMIGGGDEQWRKYLYY
jgi:hypothetical protein